MEKGRNPVLWILKILSRGLCLDYTQITGREKPSPADLCDCVQHNGEGAQSTVLRVQQCRATGRQRLSLPVHFLEND